MNERRIVGKDQPKGNMTMKEIFISICILFTLPINATHPDFSDVSDLQLSDKIEAFSEHIKAMQIYLDKEETAIFNRERMIDDYKRKVLTDTKGDPFIKTKLRAAVAIVKAEYVEINKSKKLQEARREKLDMKKASLEILYDERKRRAVKDQN